MGNQQSDTVPFLFTVPAPPEAVPCSCGGVYSSGARVRAHSHYIKRHRAEQEAIFFQNARALHKKKKIAVYQHPEPRK